MLLSAAWCLNNFATCLPWPRSSQRFLTRVCVLAQKPCRWLDGVADASHTTRLPSPLFKRLRSPSADGTRTVWFSPSVRRGLSARLSGSPRFHVPARVSPTPPSTYNSPSFCMSPSEVALSACSPNSASEESPNSSSPLSSIWSPCYTCRSTVHRPAPRPPPSPPPFPSELPLPTPSISPGVSPLLLLPVRRRSHDSPPVLPSGLLHRMPDIHIPVSTSPRSTSLGHGGPCTPCSGSNPPGHGSSTSSDSPTSVLFSMSPPTPPPPKGIGTPFSPAGPRSHLVVATPPCQQTGYGQSAHAGPVHTQYTA